MFVHFLNKHPLGFKEYFGFDEKKVYNVIELGAGTGAVGVAFSKLYPKSRVVITEICENCIELIKLNIRENLMID